MVSMFTDVASEMLYPVMPVYLRSIGFSIILIGVMEGCVEATAGLSKGYFGNLSDHLGKRLPFVQLGYSLSAISKPLMAIFNYPIWMFFSRTLDRLGKGVRTGARDALLSDETTPQFKGQIFGFHRAFDTLGAVAGPLLALIFLNLYPEAYKVLFIIAFLPGIAAVAFTFLIKERRNEQLNNKLKPGFLDFIRYWKKSSKLYRQLVGALLVFALFNSSDIFLLLKIKEAGFNDTTVIGVYIFYNLVYAIFSYPLGILADKFGMKIIFIFGLIIFSTVYAGMALIEIQWLYFVLFFLYGLYAAATEGIAKAWITNISDKADAATSIGTFTAFQSISVLISSSLAGLIWSNFGSSSTFCLTAIISLLVAGFIMFFIKNK
jgi:MFS family permease